VDLTREQLADRGIPAVPEIAISGLGIEGLEVRASGHGRGEKTIVFTLDTTAGGRDDHGTLVRVDPTLLVATPGGCDVTLRHREVVLARTGGKTLELREHDGRLRVWCRLGPTTAVEDLAVALERGDVDLVGLELVAGEDRFTREQDDSVTRTVLALDSVSAVVLGAGVDTGRVSGMALTAARRRARAALAEHGRPGRS